MSDIEEDRARQGMIGARAVFPCMGCALKRNIERIQLQRWISCRMVMLCC